MRTSTTAQPTASAARFLIALIIAATIGCLGVQTAYADGEGGDDGVDTNLTVDNPLAKTVTTAKELRKALDSVPQSATADNPYVITVQAGEYKLTSGLFPFKIGSNTSVVLEEGAVLNNSTGNNYPIRIQGTTNASITGGKLVGGGVYVEKNAQNAVVADMTIENPTECGIKCETGNEIVVKGNTVTGSAKYSIYAKGINGAIEVTDNIVKDSADNGIMIFECESFAGDIARNTVSDVKLTGIYIAWSAIDGNILSNKVLRAKGNGITLYHNSHCKKIDGNYLDTIGGNQNGTAGNYGILLSVSDTGKEGKVYADSITNNTVRNVTYCGITVYTTTEGAKYDGYAYVKGDISGNTLYNCGTYNPGKDWKNAKRRGSLASIYIDKRGLVNGNITNNKVDKSGEYGIYVHDFSTVKGNIANNTVTNSGVDAIQLYKSKVNGNITKNTIKNSKRYAFRMYSSTLKGNFSNNTITKTSDKGMCITESSKVAKAITGNKMTTIGGDAIYVGKKSTVATISKNTATAVKGSGVSLADKAKVTTISGNKFTGKKATDSRGVLVRTGCVATNIKSNTIKSMGWGITVKDTTAKTTIKSNIISGCTKNVIAVGSMKYTPTQKAKLGKVSVNK